MPRLFQRVSRQAADTRPSQGRARERASDTYVYNASLRLSGISLSALASFQGEKLFSFLSPLALALPSQTPDHSSRTTLRKTFARFLSRLRRSLALFYGAYPEEVCYPQDSLYLRNIMDDSLIVTLYMKIKSTQSYAYNGSSSFSLRWS